MPIIGSRNQRYTRRNAVRLSLAAAHDSFDPMRQSARNLRYLLWKNDVDRQQWPDQLAAWARCSRHRATELLEDGAMTSIEQRTISEALDLPEETIQFSDLLGEDNKVNVLDENVRYLLGDLHHGEKKRLATAIGVDETTISRWTHRGQVPRTKHVEALGQYFDLSVDLRVEPVFLWTDPVTDRQRRRWLRERIDDIQPERLRELFKALERLLGIE